MKGEFEMKLSEMTYEQLVELFNNNKSIRDKAFDRAMDNAQFWCGEYLDCFNRDAISYSIGYDRGAYFRIDNRYGFLDGLEKLQKNYGFLKDEYTSKIDELRKMLDRYNYDDMSDEEYNVLEEKLDEEFDELEEKTFKRLMSEYEAAFEEDTQISTFVSCMVDELEADDYIAEGYKLVREVHYMETLE